MCSCSRYEPYKIIQKNSSYFGYIDPILLWKNSLKMLIFEVFLPAREPLVTTFSRTRAVAWPKDLVKQGIKFQMHEKNINYFGNLV